MKAIFTCFSLLIGVYANATSVAWVSGNASTEPKFLGPTAEKVDSSYAIKVLFYSDAGGKNLIDTSTAKVNGMTGAFGATSAYDFTGLTTYYVQAIVENDTYIRSTDILSFDTPETGNYNMNFASGIGLTNPSGGSNTWGDWTEKGGDVPEPTTCSLLLVGLAGMGLKRLRSRRRQQA